MHSKLRAVSLATMILVSFRLVVSTTYVPVASGSKAGSAGAAQYKAQSESQTRLLARYGRLPLSFEPNRGQTDARVKFLSRRGGYTLYLTATEAVLGLSKPKVSDTLKPGVARTRRAPRAILPDLSPKFPSPAPAEVSSNSALPEAQDSLRMRLLGANPAPRLVALDELPGKSNYLIGPDPAKWRTNVPNYAKMKYQDVYPGVDLVYYGNQGRLEYDFVVARGADPRAIKLDISGAKGEKIDRQGDLLLDMGAGEVRFHKPVVYQALAGRDGGKRFIDGRFVLLGGSRAGFEVAAYDASKPLVIDPVLTYSTYLGGSGDDFADPINAQGIAVDPEGNAYLIGTTNSTDFPVTEGAFQTTFAGASDNGSFFPFGDAFVTKLNATGDALVYSTYLGGTADDSGEGIAVDSAGHAFVAGETLSTDFPITPGAFQPVCASCANATPAADNFAAKLSRDGSSLIYSTYIGGSDWDLFPMIALDRFDNMYIEGTTFSTDFPVTKGAFQTACASCANGKPDTYVTKLNPQGTGLVYSTYLGGSDFDVCGSQIAVDSGGNVYVNGFTFSTDFPVTRLPSKRRPGAA